MPITTTFAFLVIDENNKDFSDCTEKSDSAEATAKPSDDEKEPSARRAKSPTWQPKLVDTEMADDVNSLVKSKSIIWRKFLYGQQDNVQKSGIFFTQFSIQFEMHFRGFWSKIHFIFQLK